MVTEENKQYVKEGDSLKYSYTETKQENKEIVYSLSQLENDKADLEKRLSEVNALITKAKEVGL